MFQIFCLIAWWFKLPLMIFLFFQVGLFKVYSRLGFDQKGGKLLDWLFWSNLLEALTGDSYQMSYQVIWYCLGMREILNVPLDSIKYVTFSIPVILIRRLLSTGPLQKHSVNSDIFSKTRNCHLKWLSLSNSPFSMIRSTRK